MSSPTISSFDTLDLTGMEIDPITFTVERLSAKFGGGFRADARVGASYPLWGWEIASDCLPDDTAYGNLIAGKTRMAYYTDFIVDHTVGDESAVFIISFRGKKYFAAFADNDFSGVMETIDLFGLSGVKIEYARVAGITYNDDGSIYEDADVDAFIAAAAITDGDQQNALYKLAKDLKAASIWTKMKAVYPLVGGTAASHKWNLKDPRDLDAAYRLTFAGGWTHSSNGALPNGSTGYADTKFNASTKFTLNSHHASFYSRTNVSGLTKVDLGAETAAPLLFAFNLGGNAITFVSGDTSNIILSTPPNTQGLFTLSRTTSTLLTGFKNSTSLGTDTDTNGGLPNLNLYLGADNSAGTAANFSTRQLAFATLGDGLSAAEVTSLYTAVQAFQTKLGREV